MNEKNLIHIPLNLPGKVYRSPMPFAAFDEHYSTLEEYLQADIDTVVMLTESGEDLRRANMDLQNVYKENEIGVIHFPIVDFDTPDDLGGLKDVLHQVVEKAELGENIAVHCFAGRGRTGMFIALLSRLVLGLDGQAAIDWVRQYFPAIETSAQEQIVIGFDPDD
jgi:protein-tyrosine phosphatase